MNKGEFGLLIGISGCFYGMYLTTLNIMNSLTIPFLMMFTGLGLLIIQAVKVSKEAR